jgi:drug/metabolite transporter (DMT)-like permease
MHLPEAGELAALGTACCWTVTALSFESAGRRVGSLPVNLIRLLMAFLLLTLFNLLYRGRALPGDCTAAGWGWLALSGLVGFSLGDLCLFQAFVTIGSRLSLLLMSLVPPVTALLGWLVLEEVLGAWDLAGMFLTVAGIVLVVTERPARNGGRFHPGGILLGILGAVGQGVGLVLSKVGMEAGGAAGGSYDPFPATQIRILAGIAGFALIFTFLGWWPKVTAACRNRHAMNRIGLGAFFGPFLGVSLSLWAVKNTEVGVGATIMAITPVLIIPPAAIIHREKVSFRAVFGATVSVAGVALLMLQ